MLQIYWVFSDMNEMNTPLQPLIHKAMKIPTIFYNNYDTTIEWSDEKFTKGKILICP